MIHIMHRRAGGDSFRRQQRVSGSAYEMTKPTPLAWAICLLLAAHTVCPQEGLCDGAAKWQLQQVQLWGPLQSCARKPGLW